jgi:glutathione synthase/RimK-type ligase-like ATP-grasp enzyme
MTATTLRIAAADAARSPRIGIARLTKMAFDGAEFAPQWNALVGRVQQNPQDVTALMDLSVIAQLTGDPATGASLQSRALVQEVVYRSPGPSANPRLRLLAFAAPVDIGGNTPIEFLLEGSDVQLETLYIAPGLALPDPLPAHDIAIVTIPDSVETRPMLNIVEKLAPQWPRPILNLPQRIKGLDRDLLFQTLSGAPGIEIPMTGRVSREDFADMALSEVILHDVIADGEFPLIARPAGSHAGIGLEKIDTPEEIEAYLASRLEDEFFVSRFVDYAGPDGQFRKYRVVFIDGRAYACHMAVCDEWKVWYLNADMTGNTAKRAEEAHFMARFDEDFALWHANALKEVATRIGLDYFQIDCAQTKDGKLLVFEADNAAIVHNMDPPDIFPYKGPQMRKVFDAFVTMLRKYAAAAEARAA